MTHPICLSVGIIAVALYLYSGWQTWVVLGLTDTSVNRIDMLRAPQGGIQRAAFFSVLMVFLLSWPLWMAAGRINAWRDRRAAASRATGCTKT